METHMKRTIGTAAAFAFATLCLSESAGAEIVIIKVPHAFAVFPTALNDKGLITGYYVKKGHHGFIWRPHGALVTFDVPGAEYTNPAGISQTGVVTGSYSINRVPEGFVRAA